MIISLFFSAFSISAQNTVPLNTPYSWVKDARDKANAKDSAAAYVSMMNAVKAGLFDPQVLAGNSRLTELLSAKQKEEITSAILANRKKIEKPSAIKIVTEDIDRFWKVYPQIKDSSAETIFLNDYILKGSTGLRTFYQVRMNSSLARFIQGIRAKQSYYTSIKAASTQFKNMRPQFIAAAKKLEALYPASVFPPIYFLIGHLNNVGTADGYAGLLIGTEHLCRSTQADTSNLTDNEKLVLFDTALAVPLIVHEYVHFQQKNVPEQTLLEYAIVEGTADFIAYLATGKYSNPDVFKYGFEHEQAIWKKFKSEMAGTNTDDWIFNAYNPLTGYPGNLGYFVGFRICESYYRNSDNAQQAVKELLEIKDFNEVLRKSKYQGL